MPAEDIQFIIESPHQKRAQKKRPRLVTSCDSCRAKKIKCLQSSLESKCEACILSDTSCEFFDRERYFEERSRAISVPPTPRSPKSVPSASAGWPSHHLPEENGLRAARPSSPLYTGSNNNHKRNGSLPSATTLNFSAGYQPDSYPYPSPPNSYNGPLTLFDPRQPNYPTQFLMHTFMQIFFQSMGGEFPFLGYEETFQRLETKSLPPLLANCIAALTASFSNVLPLTGIDAETAADNYEAKAKILLNPALQMASFDTLHSLILLFWIERRNGSFAGLQTYYHLAMSMAQQLGLSNEVAHLSPSDPYHRKLRSIWTSLIVMQQMLTQRQ